MSVSASVMMHTLRKHMDKGELKVWAGFAVAVIIVFALFSDGDFSFLLTFSSLISMFSFGMVAVKIESGQTVKGVSLRMMECYMLLIFARLCSIIPFEGYLPYDKTGDWLYQTVEAFTFCLAGSIVYQCRVRFRDTYDPHTDILPHVYLMGVSAVLALIFHPSLNAFPPADMAWTFALYLESVAALPQLLLFQKESQVEPFTSHFLAGQAIGKVMSFIFWASSFSELSDADHPVKSYVGVWVMLMQVLQLVVMGDFIYSYVRCIRKGISVSQLLAPVEDV